jgi:hypothetical protein
MSKVDLETLKFILQRNVKTDQNVAIMKEIELELKAEEEEKALRPPAIKKQNVIMISSPGQLYTKGTDHDLGVSYEPVKDIVGWIAQIPEGDDIQETVPRIHKAAHEFNTTPKGTRMPVGTVGEACEVIQAKFFKEQNVWIKSKTPLLILPVDNKIPQDQSE